LGQTALVLGATGLVGSELVNQLLEDPAYDRVTVLTRRSVPSAPKLRQLTVDFERLEQYKDEFQVDAVYCCLGTTMKQAGSRNAFTRVDLEYPVLAARLAKEASARCFAVISALGVKESSPFFYNRVKARMEREVRETGLPSVHVFRPSLLLGDRREHRSGEAAASKLSRGLTFLWKGPLRKYKPVQARTVANAMRAAVSGALPGFHIYDNQVLEVMAP
jgi:uncharacterized protein YbjT (DUF2867 family)